MEHANLTEKIIGCAFLVHWALGSGYLESVYQKALTHELGKAGLIVECERRLEVAYDGVIVGTFIADIIVDDLVIVEVKAVRTLAPVHGSQLVNYLTATGIDVGLLLNFGAAKLEIRRVTRTYHPRTTP